MEIIMEARFKVGDWVWHATFDSREKWAACPDCLGHKFAKVTFGDGTEVSVDCQSCALGYNPPSGLIKYWQPEPMAQHVFIQGLSISRDEIRYSLSDHRGGNEEDVFDNEEVALIRAKQLASEFKVAEEARIARKDKPSTTWASNASYHRKQLKSAQRDLEYHTRKLEAAKRHAKETKDALDTETNQRETL